MNPRTAQWLLSRDTGLSSIAIVAFMEGAGDGKYSHPLDPDDLGRCIRLLSLAPEYRARLEEMKAASPQWAVLIEHWAEIEKLYFLEFSMGCAPACNDRMRDLLDSIPWLPPLAEVGQQAMLIQGGLVGQITAIEWIKRDYSDVKLWEWSYTIEGVGFVKAVHREAFDILKEDV